MIEGDSVLNSVRNFGQVNISVEGSEFGPPYAYTVGLEHTYGHPELIIFGLDPEPSDIILNEIILMIRKGEFDFKENSLLHGIGKFPFSILKLEKLAADPFVEETVKFYQGSDFQNIVRYIQVVWPDAQGLFPWDEGFDPLAVDYQPALWDLTETSATLAYLIDKNSR